MRTGSEQIHLNSLYFPYVHNWTKIFNFLNNYSLENSNVTCESGKDYIVFNILWIINLHNNAG